MSQTAAADVPSFQHARYDDIIGGNNEQVFEKDEFYTAEEVNRHRFCAFRKEDNGETKFRCAMPLRYDGERLCQTHHKAWINQKKQEEQERQRRREDWFERQCEIEYNNMIKNGNVTFSSEVTTKEQKEDIMWKMAQALVRGRDRYAKNE